MLDVRENRKESDNNLDLTRKFFLRYLATYLLHLQKVPQFTSQGCGSERGTFKFQANLSWAVLASN